MTTFEALTNIIDDLLVRADEESVALKAAKTENEKAVHLHRYAAFLESARVVINERVKWSSLRQEEVAA